MTANSLAFQSHDHRACIEAALRTARDVCEQRSVRLTPLREEVLKLVWQSHKPLGAYALLEQLAAVTPAGQRRRLGPPTVYRALEFLREHGLVHRINSLNAFIGCQHPADRHHCYFLICHKCESTVEMAAEPLAHAVRTATNAAHFAVDSVSVEITGLCPGCQP